MKRVEAIVGLTALAVVFALSVGWARDPTAGSLERIYTRLSVDQISEILDDMELAYVTTTTEEELVWFFERAGMMILLLSRSDASGITSLQLYTYNSLPGPPDYELINEWNRTKRFSRAYLDRDGDAVLEADLDVSMGIPLSAINRFIDMFTVSAMTYKAFVEG